MSKKKKKKPGNPANKPTNNPAKKTAVGNTAAKKNAAVSSTKAKGTADTHAVVPEEPPRPPVPQPRTVAGQIVEYTPDPDEKKEEESFVEDKLELATMSFSERRKAKKAKREKEMEGMNRKQRIKYLLYYYQWPIIITLLVGGCVIWLILAVTRSKPPVALSAAVLNCSDRSLITEEIFADYMVEANINTTYRTVVECFHLDQNTLMEDFYNDPSNGEFTRFPALARESYYDIVITNRGGLDYCSNTEIAIYPDYVLSLDLLEALKPYEAEAKDAYGQTFVYGYDISDTDFAKSLNLGYDEVFICFPGSTSESQMHAENFIRYIFKLPRAEE